MVSAFVTQSRVGTQSAWNQVQTFLDNEQGYNAMTIAAKLEVNPLFVRHDLMIEMARLEMEIEDIRGRESVNAAAEDVVPLQQRLQKISHVLSRVPA